MYKCILVYLPKLIVIIKSNGLVHGSFRYNEKNITNKTKIGKNLRNKQVNNN